jgi:hypothetical protein
MIKIISLYSCTFSFDKAQALSAKVDLKGKSRLLWQKWKNLKKIIFQPKYESFQNSFCIIQKLTKKNQFSPLLYVYRFRLNENNFDILKKFYTWINKAINK